MNTDDYMRLMQDALARRRRDAIINEWFIDDPTPARKKKSLPPVKLEPVPLSELLVGAAMCPVERALEFV